MCAVFTCEVLDEDQSGICVEFDVVGAAMVALVCSSTACGSSGGVLAVGHGVVVFVGIIREV